MKTLTKDNKAQTITLDTLLQFIKWGGFIFPLNPGEKTPLTKKGFKNSTNDPEQIKRWHKMYPNANWGLDCKKTGLVVFDLDVKNGIDGVKAWQILCAELNIEYSNTVISNTPTGGKHIYFKRPSNFKPSNSTGKLPTGIDVRSNGYVALPGSIHPNGGKYVWQKDNHPQDVSIAMLPSELEQLLKSSKRHDDNKKGIILKGRRDNWLTSEAGKLRSKGLGEEDIYISLQSLNSNCSPPKDDRDLRRIAKSVCNYPPKPNFPESQTDEQIFDLSDLGNAKRLSHLFGKDILYCTDNGKWFIWDGKRWFKDDAKKIRTYAHSIAELLLTESTKISDEEYRQKMKKKSLSFQSHSHISGMLEEAKALQPVTQQKFDKEPFLFNCANGIIDLKSGNLLQHERTKMLSKISQIEFTPNLKSNLWNDFLSTILQDNNKLIGFLQKAVGYSMTASISEQCFFILFGEGNNGKSTFLNIIMSLLGDYASQTPTDTLLVKNNQGIPNDVARLHGIRLVSASETDQGRYLSEAFIKQITGGDRITARFLHGEFFEFNPVCKVWLSTNHKPVIRGTDDAIWRRIRLIPFRFTIPDHLVDKELFQKLKKELPAILNWAIEGCLMWQKEGFKPPDDVLVATSSYRSEMDILAGFIEERCILGLKMEVTAKELYSEYKFWAESNNEKIVTSTQFGRLLIERGLTKYRQTTGTKPITYRGIALNDS